MIDMTPWQTLAAQRIHDRPDAPGRMRGKVALITGAAQGFGLGIAQFLHREGAAVVLADYNLPLAQKEAQKMGDRALAVYVESMVDDHAICTIGGESKIAEADDVFDHVLNLS